MSGLPVKNVIVALVAIALSVTLFLGLNSQDNVVSLEAQAEQSVPLELAVANGRPSLVEFYANWCTTCQAMAPELAELKENYQNQVNFVMLNVDNPKWLPEVLQYRVDGIPHFVYLDSQGKAIAQTIGEQPSDLMASNLQALAQSQPLPYTNALGQVSDFNPPTSDSTEPRSHSS